MKESVQPLRRRLAASCMILLAEMTSSHSLLDAVSLVQAQAEESTSSYNTDKSSFSFYDDLRSSSTASFRPMYEPEDQPGRVMHIVNDTVRLDRETITMCHVPIFLRYTDHNEITGDFVDVSPQSYGGTAAAVLAMHHFNNGDGSIVDKLAGINNRCNIRFTTEVFDTQSSSVAAVQNLANLITNRRDTDIVKPQAGAIMGAAWFDISQSMATVTGVYDLLQVSPSSSSMSLDSMSKYPLFSRTHPSDEAKGILAVDYFEKVLNVKHFGILFVNSELGISLQKKVVDLASERNMTVRSVAFEEDEAANPVSLRNSLLQLKDTKFNYFMGIFFPLNYAYVMEIAAGLGVAGPGKFWLLTGHLADAFAGGNTTIVTGSNASIGSIGNAILHDDGGVDSGLLEYDKFLAQWQKIGKNRGFLDYINSKQPPPPEGSGLNFTQDEKYFDLRPSHYAQFSYDAIAGMGLAACEAARVSEHKDNHFTGKEHHDVFVNSSFLGATGNVTFAPGSFSRSGYSTYYFVSQIYEVDRQRNNLSVFSGKTGYYFDIDSREWGRWPGSSAFVYSDGSISQPQELPPYTENRQSVSTPVLVICLLLATGAMLTSICLMVFVFVKKESKVIIASQPPFLYMLCTGTLVLSSAIVPLMVDDSIASVEGCTFACISRIWLVSIGFTITFSALFSKTWRVNKLFKNARGYKRVTLKVADVMIPFFILLGCNVLILSLWTAMAPLKWVRKPLAKDPFGRILVSVGSCYNKDWAVYGIALYVVNGIALILAIVEAYRARHITTEFSESKYIAMAMVCIFQALFVGVPLYFIAQDWPAAQLFVVVAMIFIICMAVLLLIFVPKILVMRAGTGSVDMKGRHCSITGNGSWRSHRRSTVNSVPPLSRFTTSTNVNESVTGLEEKVWNSAHSFEVQRLTEELYRATHDVETLQAEIEALTWGGRGNVCSEIHTPPSEVLPRRHSCDPSIGSTSTNNNHLYPIESSASVRPNSSESSTVSTNADPIEEGMPNRRMS